MRNAILALMVVTLTATAAPAQAWAEKMFKEGTTHDFGNVPRGTELFHQFKITNIYAVRMEVVSIHSGCNCTTATCSKRVLESHETATIDVSMDAKRFTGAKTVLVRVTVGPEYTSAAELKVTANSRADVVFNPSQISFGNVNVGQTPDQTIDLEYAGKLDFKISEVVAKDLPLDVSFVEAYRRPGQVGYKVKVVLKSSVPAGLFKDNVYLKTNDPASPMVPLLVEANVQTAVSLSANSFNLGTVKVGDAVTRRVQVKGNKPLKILSVEGVGNGVEVVDLPAAATDRQTVTFKCQFIKDGEFKRELKIKTDLQEAPLIVTIEGSAAK
jgi:Protein of unknown function (DUF1573)